MEEKGSGSPPSSPKLRRASPAELIAQPVYLGKKLTQVACARAGILMTDEKVSRLVRWSFLAGVQVVQSNPMDFIIRALAVEKLEKNTASLLAPIPEKPDDPSDFKAPKWPELKLIDIVARCKSSDHAAAWVKSIRRTLRKAFGQKFGENIVVFINPFSGTKKAVKVWEKVEPLFLINDAKLTVITTRAAGHCKQESETMDLRQVDRLITVSGDGLLNELLNGLMKRTDWMSAVSIPLGIIPAGSGNAMSTACGSPNALGSALAIAKGTTRPLDLLAFYQLDTERKENADGSDIEEAAGWKLVSYGFEALMWALISDIDIESESMRWMGANRFVFGAVKRIMALRHYPGKLLYAPSLDEGMKVCNWPSPCPSCSPTTKHDHEHPSVVEVEPSEEAKLKKKHKKHKEKKSTPLLRGLAPGLRSKVHFDPMTDSALPESWKKVDGSFVYFVGSNISHISNDFLSNPYAHMADGTIDVAYCNDLDSKMKMLSVMAAEMESGKYVRHDFINYVKTTALALIPTGKPGIMDIDGEPFPGRPTIMEVHQAVLTICCCNWHLELPEKYCT